MKVHVFAPNIVIDIPFIYIFQAGQKLVRLLQDGQRKFCTLFCSTAIDRDRTTLLTTDFLINCRTGGDLQRLTDNSLHVNDMKRRRGMSLLFLTLKH